jgi:hypothetical protein
VTVREEVIALAYLRQRLVEQREVWQARVDATYRSPDKWATRLQALGAREAFRIAILLCDEALDQLEPRKGNTKPNAH